MTSSRSPRNATCNGVTEPYVTPLLTPLVTPFVTQGVTPLVTPPPTRPDPYPYKTPSTHHPNALPGMFLNPPRRCHPLQTADQDRQGQK